MVIKNLNKLKPWYLFMSQLTSQIVAFIMVVQEKKKPFTLL